MKKNICLNSLVSSLVVLLSSSVAVSAQDDLIHIALLPKEVKELKISFENAEKIKKGFSEIQSWELGFPYRLFESTKAYLPFFTVVIGASIARDYAYKNPLNLPSRLASIAVGLVLVELESKFSKNLIEVIIPMAKAPFYFKIKNREARSCKNWGFASSTQEWHTLMSIQFTADDFLNDRVFMNGHVVSLQKAIDLDLIDGKELPMVFGEPIRCQPAGYLFQESTPVDLSSFIKTKTLVR